jgi:hypothetical protein
VEELPTSIGDSKVGPGDDGLSEYERARLRNIEENNRQLSELGLEHEGGQVGDYRQHCTAALPQRLVLAGFLVPRRQTHRQTHRQTLASWSHLSKLNIDVWVLGVTRGGTWVLSAI